MTATVEALAHNLAARGVHLEARGDRLHVEAPLGVLSGDLREALRAHKPALLALLPERDPLPPPGDPRRPALELVDDVWAAGGRVIVAGGAAHVEPRESSDGVPVVLSDRLHELERDVVAALTRRPS